MQAVACGAIMSGQVAGHKTGIGNDLATYLMMAVSAIVILKCLADVIGMIRDVCSTPPEEDNENDKEEKEMMTMRAEETFLEGIVAGDELPSRAEPVKLWRKLATTVTPAAVPAKTAPVAGAANVAPPLKRRNTQRAQKPKIDIDLFDHCDDVDAPVAAPVPPSGAEPVKMWRKLATTVTPSNVAPPPKAYNPAGAAALQPNTQTSKPKMDLDVIFPVGIPATTPPRKKIAVSLTKEEQAIIAEYI